MKFNKTIIKNARIIDGTGAPAVENGLIVLKHNEGVDNDVIEYAGISKKEILDSINLNDRVIDLKGEYSVLPGLVDAHTHLEMRTPYPPKGYDGLGPALRTLMTYRRAAEALECGVTTIRNLGGSEYFDLALRHAEKVNMLCAPRIVAAGHIICAHGGHGSEGYGKAIECSGVHEFLKTTRLEIAKGVNWIKLCYTGGLAGSVEGLNDMQMTEEELLAVINCAHDKNIKVAAHLSNDYAIRRSVELGIDSVEHAYSMKEETAELMAGKGTRLVPTLCVSCADYLVERGCSDYEVKKSAEAAPTHRAGFAYAVKHGVTICGGSDLLPSDPMQGTTATIREVELMSELGLGPLEAIKAMTHNSAELCGLLDIIGTIESGKKGDIIICKGNPDEKISDLRQLSLVAKNCRIIWSTIPGCEERNYNVTVPGTKAEGGIFSSRAW